MEDKLIDFQTAVLAKEKGFDEEVLHFYKNAPSNHTTLIHVLEVDTHIKNEETWSAPTQSLLQAWLREKYNIQIAIIPFADSSWDENSDRKYYYVVNPKMFYGFINKDESVGFKTYEEALEQGLLAALKLIKEKYEK
jgi:hypothetical protein